MNDNKKWLSEYEKFLKSEETQVPQMATDRVFSVMEKLINPSSLVVFAKLLAIHLVVGSLSLSVCHQFGMNPFMTSYSLDQWFMTMWGHGTCMLVCGTVFLGITFLSAGYFLSIEEVRALKRTEFLQALVLGLISLGIFAGFGAQLVITFAGLWLLGGLIGGFLATEAIWTLKRV